MRDSYPVLVLSFLFLFSSSSILTAGGVINNQVFSAEYIRTFSRNAATDSSDAVTYNPAGVMRLEDGNYLNFSLSHVIKKYSNRIGGIEFSSDIPSDVPSLIALHKEKNWAAFFAFTIPAGGGMVEFEKGTGTTYGIGVNTFGGGLASHELKANSTYFGYTLGGAYKINERLSMALGTRYIEAQKGADASVTERSLPGYGEPGYTGPTPTTLSIKYSDTARGWGWLTGLNIKASDKVNIGMRYESSTPLRFKRDLEHDDFGGAVTTDGFEEVEDLPGLAALGVAYQVTPNTSLMWSFTQYLEGEAKFESSSYANAESGYETALSVERVFSNKLKVSIGYMYTDTKIPTDDKSFENPPLGAQTYCGGFAYATSPETNFNLGISKSVYEGETTSSGIGLNKDLLTIALGVDHRF